MRLHFHGVVAVVLFFTLTGSAQFDPLVQSLERGNVEQKRNALASIRNLRSADASRIAIAALKDSSVLVRATAAASIIFLPTSEAASLLIPMLRDQDEFVRREAAYALGEVGDRAAVAPLLTLLNRERTVEVRSAVVIALGGAGDMSAIAPLVAILEKRPREEDEFLRRSAARSIGRIAQFARTGTRDSVTPQNFLPDRFKDLKAPSAKLTQEQVMGFRPAVTTLLKVLANPSESDDSRRETAYALGAIGDASALPALRAKIGAADNYLSEISREAVAKIDASNGR